MFNQLAMQGFNFFPPIAGGWLLGILAGTIGGVGNNLVSQHIQGALEAGAGIYRYAHRKNMPPKMFFCGFQDGLKIGVFLVERVDDYHLGDAIVRCIIPGAICANPQPMLRLNYHQRKITHP